MLSLLPDPVRAALAKGPILRPWADSAITRMLGTVYFPLSRAWAAAILADGSEDRFLAELPLARPPRGLGRALAAVAQRNRAHSAWTARWEAAFFGDETLPPAALARRNRRWLDSARALMAARRFMLPARLRNRIPPVRWQVAPPDAVAAREAPRLADPSQAFALPDPLPPVAVSRMLWSKGRTDYWLRFPSPVAGDMAWALVSEPTDRPEAPTFVFLHGLAVDPEYTPDPRDTVARLVRRGVRVIQPEAPLHARRRPDGFYGGEATVAGGPESLIRALHAAVVESGIWVAWARSRSGAAVALGGFSLGAISAQMAASAAHGWPDAARPDALLLVATGADMSRTLFYGSLARAVGMPKALHAAGWTPEEVRRWDPLLRPQRAPAVPPDRIVAWLGSADDLTHCDDATAMLRGWRLPEQNLHVVRKGHYTTAFDVALRPEPLERLLAALGA